MSSSNAIYSIQSLYYKWRMIFVYTYSTIQHINYRNRIRFPSCWPVGERKSIQ